MVGAMALILVTRAAHQPIPIFVKAAERILIIILAQQVVQVVCRMIWPVGIVKWLYIIRILTVGTQSQPENMLIL